MKHNIILLVTILIFCGLSQGQQNFTGFVFKDCNQKGFPDQNGNCLCALGWFGDNCEKNPANSVPGLWWTFRVLMLLIFTFFLAVSFVATILAPSKKSKNVESAQAFSFFNVKRFALGSVVLLSLNSLLYYACDPEGFDGAGIPPWVGLLFFMLTWPLVSTMFQIVLFHWVEIYYKTIKVLRREEMLSKINRNYESNVTLDDIMAKVKFVSRFKVPFLILNVIPYVLALITVIFTSVPSLFFFGFFVLVVYQVYCTIMFLLETIGFIIYGRRMTRLMPKPLDQRMRKITTTISFMAGLFCFGWVFAILSYFALSTSSAGYMVASIVSRVITIVIITTMLSIFFKVVKKRVFCCLAMKNSQSQSQNSTAGGSSTVKRSIDMELTTTEGNSLSADV